MAIKGQKESAETRAKKSAVQKARWAEIKRKVEKAEVADDNMRRMAAVAGNAIQEAHLINSVHPRCKRSLRDQLWVEVKHWFGGK